MKFTKYNKNIELCYGTGFYDIVVTVYKNNTFSIECESNELENEISTFLNEDLDLYITDYTPDELEELIKHYIYR